MGAMGADGTDVTAIHIYIYIVMRLERHGNRLYGFMGLLSKKWDWIEWSGVDGMDG